MRGAKKMAASIQATTSAEQKAALAQLKAGPDVKEVARHLLKQPHRPLAPDLLLNLFWWLQKQGQLPQELRKAPHHWLFPAIEKLMSVGFSHAEACRQAQKISGYNVADPESLKRNHNRWLARHPEHRAGIRAMRLFKADED